MSLYFQRSSSSVGIDAALNRSHAALRRSASHSGPERPADASAVNVKTL